MKTAHSLKLAESLIDQHLHLVPAFAHYTGIVSLYALSRLAVLTGDERLVQKAKLQLDPFVSGARGDFRCNFPNYRCGGIGSAFLLWQGLMPEAEEPVRRHAEMIRTEAPRDPDGILCHPKFPGEDRIFIDVAFAVTPFLLFAGLALKEDAYIEDAFQQTRKMVQHLRNEETGLLHQTLNFKGPGLLSDDHWSRGNGWGAFALTELAVHLPERDTRRTEALPLYLDHLTACGRFQNDNGLWHQEMTEPKSYVETSGSALMLYALAAGINAGLIAQTENERLVRGLTALLAYITDEFDIHHTCTGCLCPGHGTKLDYMVKPPVLNDTHGFGPLALAFGQAWKTGIVRVSREGSVGVKI